MSDEQIDITPTTAARLGLQMVSESIDEAITSITASWLGE
jgi:hypothetical protein